MGMKQKKKFWEEIEKVNSKQLSFSTSPKGEQYLPKFRGLIQMLVGLIDVKGIDVA